MTRETNYNLLEELLQILQKDDSAKLLNALQLILNESMKLERTQALKAKPFERSENRQGWANGFKDKTVLTGLGKLKVKIPQVRNGEPFYPSALEKGKRNNTWFQVKFTSKIPVLIDFFRLFIEKDLLYQ